MTTHPHHSDDAARLLAWYVAMGVDEVIGDAPSNWAEMTFRSAPPPPDAVGSKDLAGASPSRASLAPARPPSAPQAQQRQPDFGPPPDFGEPPPDDEFDQRYEPPRPSSSRPQPTTGASISRPGAQPADEAVMAARRLASQAESLDALEALLRNFDGCGLKATAKSLCFYRGAPRARVMVIGEAPGRDEDLAGKPFVGRAGQLLDKMLAAIDLDESSVHITNVVYWRPPGNRTPTPLETQICQPFLERQIALVSPDVVICVGGAAAKQVLDTAEGIMRLRGKWREIDSGGRKVRAMATLHPAYLLRTPAAKRMAWRDLMAVKAALDGH